MWCELFVTHTKNPYFLVPKCANFNKINPVQDCQLLFEMMEASTTLKYTLYYKVSSPPQQLWCMSIHQLFEKTEITSRIAAISQKKKVLDLKEKCIISMASGI